MFYEGSRGICLKVHKNNFKQNQITNETGSDLENVSYIHKDMEFGVYY